jgi:hypothetical protein
VFGPLVHFWRHKEAIFAGKKTSKNNMLFSAAIKNPSKTTFPLQSKIILLLVVTVETIIDR